MDKNELLRLARESKKTDLSVLITAKEEAKQAVLQSKTKANLDAYDKASKMLDDYLERETQKESQAGDPLPDPPQAVKFTRTRLQTGPGSVLEQLKAAGYQVEKTKLNKDVQDGRLARDKGWFTPARIRKYAELLPRVDTGRTDNDYHDDLLREKMELENRRRQLDIEDRERKKEIDEGKWVLRDHFEKELAARLVVLYSDFTRMAYSRALEFIHLTGGDMKRNDDLAIALISAMDGILQNYATTRKFHVLIEPPTNKD